MISFLSYYTIGIGLYFIGVGLFIIMFGLQLRCLK